MWILILVMIILNEIFGRCDFYLSLDCFAWSACKTFEILLLYIHFEMVLQMCFIFVWLPWCSSVSAYLPIWWFKRLKVDIRLIAGKNLLVQLAERDLACHMIRGDLKFAFSSHGSQFLGFGVNNKICIVKSWKSVSF